MADELKCDFCSQRPIRWSYPARPVHLVALLAKQGESALTAVGWNSNDPWAACDPCHDLIERGDRTALRERAVSKFPRHGSLLTAAQLRMVLKKAHDGFFGAVTGDPTPIP